MNLTPNNNPPSDLDKIIEEKALLEYDLHGKPLLAIATSRKEHKYFLLNEKNEEVALGHNRLFIYPHTNPYKTPNELTNFAKELTQFANKYPADTLWTLIKGQDKELSIEEIFNLSGLENNLINFAGIRRTLLLHNLYFKRSENGFRSKSEEEVGRGKEASQERMLEEKEKLTLQLALGKRIAGDKKAALPPSISYIEEISALGKKCSHAKVFSELIDNLISKLSPKVPLKHIEQKAFYILKEIGHFSDNQNLSPIRLGRPVGFNSEERSDAERLFRESKTIQTDNRIDLSSLFTFTIDSEDTQDFDDALSLVEEDGKSILWVHIADTSSHITEESPLFKTLLRRATSIYCPDETIPMLPPSLSEGVLSLKEGQRKLAISYKFELNELVAKPISIHASIIKVTKRFSYEDVDSILCDKFDHPHYNVLHTLWDLASNRELLRLENGAILFNRRELTPSIEKGKKIKLVINSDDTPSRKLVSELMILTNEFAGSFAINNNIPFVYRSQEGPDVDIESYASAIPDGPAREFSKRGLLKKSNISLNPGRHAGLGLNVYCQVTSPIRRALDHILINQLRTFILTGEVVYSREKLDALLGELQLGGDEAHIIQRERTRYWLLKYMEQEKYKGFTGTIVRVDGARPLIELDNLYSIFTFNPAKEVGPSRLGENIRLVITKLDPQNEKLYLDEEVG